MKIKRYIVWVFWCTVVLAIPIGVAVNSNSGDPVIIEKHGIRLEIPKKYLYSNRFPWIDKASGLDSSKNSFMIQIPREEIKSILPASVTQEKRGPIDLTVVVFLMTPAERKNSIAVAQANVDEIAHRQGVYEQAYERIDNETGLYLVYMNPEWPSWWEVFSRSPLDKRNPVSYRDSIASCSKDGHIGVSCTLSLFVLDNMQIEFGLKGEYLPYREDIQEYITDLLQNWRVE